VIAIPPPPTEPSGAVRSRCRWILPPAPDRTAVAELAADLGLPEPICRLLHVRGYRAGDAARLFLRPRLEQLHDAGWLRDIQKAVDRLAAAVAGGETILVHGDYDVDGICATTLLTRAIRSLGGTVVPFIPHRVTDGYDLGEAGVHAAMAHGARVVLTADCGTSARSPIERLQGMGIDVIVTDHHLPSAELPGAYAVLNARQPGCEYPDKDLAAVGVAFKLMLALTRAVNGNENVVYGMLDLVALATVADIAPLRGENRVFVRFGLKLLNETRNLGLRALIRAAGLEGKPLTAGRIGYILAPRLNAVGRLGHALRGVELLLATTEHEANVIARELEELNRRRQDLDRTTLDEARVMVDRLDLDSTFGIVLGAEGWHPGVIGIVASRIVETCGRPTILVALDGDEGKGSGRSISAFDLHAGIGACRELLVRYGGHRAAAGITIARDQLPAFSARFNEVARERLTPDDLVPELKIDLELPLDDVNDELERLLRHLEPCGVGNPSPVLMSPGVRLAGQPRVVGRNGLKLRLQTATGELEAIGWDLAPLARRLDMSAPLDVVYRLDRDEYRGESRLQLRIADIRC
jgi:single-stranded-DNA-specific exonuclease